MKKIRNGSLAEQVLLTLAQSPVVTRKMLGAIMYYYDEESDRTIRYSERSQYLSRALSRVKEAGLVAEVEHEKTFHLYLTDAGAECLESNGFPAVERLEAKIKNNEAFRAQLKNHAAALYVGRSMRVFSFKNEKPSFAELATMMRSETYFGLSEEEAEKTFAQEEVENNILPYGICYSKSEIRKAYEDSQNKALFHNTSRCVGMIFKSNTITTIYEMDKKITAFWPRPEQEFNQIVSEDMSGIYDKQLTVKKVAYILTDSFVTLPSFFHGCVDGVEKAGASYSSADKKMSILKLDKLLNYHEVYFLPKRSTLSQYREDLDAYNESMEQEDYDNFCDTHPQVEGRVVIARYPNLVKLRTHYKAKDAVVLVGYGDPLIVDMLSRCMRTCLKAYYDIETGKPVPFTRYSNTGRPLIGKTNQIDHSKKAAINIEDFWNKSKFF